MALALGLVKCPFDLTEPFSVAFKGFQEYLPFRFVLNLFFSCSQQNQQEKKGGGVSTSRKGGRKILAIVERADAEQFLLELANFRGNIEAAKRLYRHNARILSGIQGEFENVEGLPAIGWFKIGVISRQLQRAWDAPDARARDWYSHQLRLRLVEWEQEAKGFKNPNAGLPDVQTHVHWNVPAETPLEATMWYFQNSIADRAKHCLNPDCPAPYFIAEKRSRKYCSPACSGPAKLESKRNWWREIGDERRRKAASR